VFGLAPGAVTGLLLVYGAAGFVGTFAGGSLVARSVRGTTMLAALLIASVLLLAGLRRRHCCRRRGPVARRAVVVVWGVGFGLIPVALTSWMLEAVPDAPEAGQALLVSGFQVAIASSAMVLSGVLVLIAALIVGTLGRVRGGMPVGVIPE
jgi:predicted MFS family arabinose efflux permease